MKNFFEILSQTPIFSGIDQDDLEKLFDNKLFRIKKFKKDELAAFAGDKCDFLMFVTEGSVRGEMVDYNGKVIKIEDITAPRPIAPAFVFGKQNTFPVNIIANETTTLFVIPRETLIKLLQDNATVLKNFLDVISDRTQFLSNKIRFLSFRTIKGKIASYLLKMAGKNTSQICLPVSQTQLADFFGVARPSLARAFAELERDGILSVNKKEITIRDRDRLSEQLN